MLEISDFPIEVRLNSLEKQKSLELVFTTVSVELFDEIISFGTWYNKVKIKHITIAECDLFFHYRDTKQISFYCFCNKTLCKPPENTHEFHLYCWNYICRVHEWCLVDCFHCEFRFSTQIMVYNYCIAKYK